MPQDEIAFVLSDESDPRYSSALQRVEEFKARGWKVVDVARRQDGNNVTVGVIVVQLD
jgi:hypothetical protein